MLVRSGKQAHIREFSRNGWSKFRGAGQGSVESCSALMTAAEGRVAVVAAEPVSGFSMDGGGGVQGRTRCPTQS